MKIGFALSLLLVSACKGEKIDWKLVFPATFQFATVPSIFTESSFWSTNFKHFPQEFRLLICVISSQSFGHKKCLTKPFKLSVRLSETVQNVGKIWVRGKRRTFCLFGTSWIHVKLCYSSMNIQFINFSYIPDVMIVRFQITVSAVTLWLITANNSFKLKYTDWTL